MADVSILDQFQPSGSVQIRDDSPLALAHLDALHFQIPSLAAELDKPIDLAILSEASVGLTASTPEPLATVSDKPQFGLSGGMNAKISILIPKQKTLFTDDQFGPPIQISAGECWASLSITSTFKPSVTATAGSIGVSISDETSVSLDTLVHFPESGSAIPTLREGLALVLEKYSVPDTPEKLRATPPGIAYAVEASGTVALGASYSTPLQVNPLATLGLPFNLSLVTQPAVTAKLKGSIALAGSFIVRTYRSPDGKLIFGLYKKKETTLAVTLSESAGIGEDIGKTDVLAKVLNAVLPAADLKNLNLDESQQADLKKALKACVDQSIAIAVNATCSASVSDEAAVIYRLDVSAGDMTATDQALAAALRGDWSLLESLPNATPIRHIIRELHERNHKLNFNLLGLYNAASVADYVKSTTVVHDEHGQIALVDKAEAKTLSAGVTPYAARTDKLRAALAQAFVATVAYGASAGKLGVTSFSVRQSILDYRAQASCSHLNHHLLLARSVGFALSPDWDALVKAGGMSNQSKFFLETAYDQRTVMRLFYQDVDARTPHSPETLDRLGRDTKIALLDPAATNAPQRRLALSNDDIWNAMNRSGNVGAFKLIPGLARLDPTALAAISADWIDIRWWSDAMQSLTPRLTSVLTALDASTSANPLTNNAFMAAHKQLEEALVKLSSKTQGAFGEGWGLAVMYRLATSTQNLPNPSAQMDIGWNQKFEHQQIGAAIAAGQDGGA